MCGDGESEEECSAQRRKVEVEKRATLKATPKCWGGSAGRGCMELRGCVLLHLAGGPHVKHAQEQQTGSGLTGWLL